MAKRTKQTDSAVGGGLGLLLLGLCVCADPPFVGFGPAFIGV